MSFEDQIKRLIYRGEDIKHHAQVSINNKCKCNDCFCCACKAWLQEHPKQSYSMEVPPVPTNLWQEDDWITWIDRHGKWI